MDYWYGCCCESFEVGGWDGEVVLEVDGEGVFYLWFVGVYWGGLEYFVGDECEVVGCFGCVGVLLCCLCCILVWFLFDNVNWFFL